MTIHIRRDILNQVVDHLDAMRAQISAAGELSQDAQWQVRDTTEALQRAVHAGVVRTLKRSITGFDLKEFVRTADDATLAGTDATPKEIADYRDAKSRLARRQATHSALAERATAWAPLVEAAKALSSRNAGAPSLDTLPPAADRSKSLHEVRAEIAVDEQRVAEIDQYGLSHSEITERVAALIDTRHDAAIDELQAGLTKMQAGQHVDLLSDDAPEPPYGDQISGWVGTALAQVSANTLGTMVVLLGKTAVMEALAPYIAQLPSGVAAAERTHNLAEIKSHLDALYKHEAALMLDDNGDLLPDVDPRRGQDPSHMVIVEASL